MMIVVALVAVSLAWVGYLERERNRFDLDTRHISYSQKWPDGRVTPLKYPVIHDKGKAFVAVDGDWVEARFIGCEFVPQIGRAHV